MGYFKNEEIRRDDERAMEEADRAARALFQPNEQAGRCSCGKYVAPKKGYSKIENAQPHLYCHDCGSEILNSGP